jgi:hypothetical protein
MIITKHGSQRIKERVGLPKRAHVRHIENVLKFGDMVTQKTVDGFKVIYNGFLYIFANTAYNEPVLVTTYEAPNHCILQANFRK